MSGETTARQEHGIYTELSKREPGMIANFYIVHTVLLEHTHKTIPSLCDIFIHALPFHC